jgi:hypothetical protein
MAKWNVAAFFIPDPPSYIDDFILPLNKENVTVSYLKKKWPFMKGLANFEGFQLQVLI